MNQEQDFLKELDEKLWKSADKMRSSMDAANYKHIALGLIFLKYVSDSFEERQQDLRKLFQDNRPENIYYLPREDYNSDSEYAEAIEAELELLEYYQEKTSFGFRRMRAGNICKKLPLCLLVAFFGKMPKEMMSNCARFPG